jgi:hypothetical protein
VQLEGIGKLKKLNDVIGNGNRVLLACSIVPPPPPEPVKIQILAKIKIKFSLSLTN